MHILDQLEQPLPENYKVKKRFLATAKASTRAFVLAEVDELDWLFYWDTDLKSWVSLRRPTPEDYDLIAKAPTV